MSTPEELILPLGTAVSAKYRGAWCEGTIKTIARTITAKVQYEREGSVAVVPSSEIRGALRVSGQVDALLKGPDKYVKATILKLNDASLYTVRFQDGDERTLRRTAVTRMGPAHFNGSDTLGGFPLTDPDSFSTPAAPEDGRKRRRAESPGTGNGTGGRDSDSAGEELGSGGLGSGGLGSGSGRRRERRSLLRAGPAPNPPNLASFRDAPEPHGRSHQVVLVNPCRGENDCWWPALVVPASEVTRDMIGAEDVQSSLVVRFFEDNLFAVVEPQYMRVLMRRSRPFEDFCQNPAFLRNAAVVRAMRFLDERVLPPGFQWKTWNSACLLAGGDEGAEEVIASAGASDDDDDDEWRPDPELERQFHAAYVHFTTAKGAPLKRTPMLGFRDLDLYRLFTLVQAEGGYDAVTAKQLWKDIYAALGLEVLATSSARQAYEKYLLSFELEAHQYPVPAGAGQPSTPASRAVAYDDGFHYAVGDKARCRFTDDKVYLVKVIDRRWAPLVPAAESAPTVSPAKHPSSTAQYQVHYDKWAKRFDEWVDISRLEDIPGVEKIKRDPRPATPQMHERRAIPYSPSGGRAAATADTPLSAEAPLAVDPPVAAVAASPLKTASGNPAKRRRTAASSVTPLQAIAAAAATTAESAPYAASLASPFTTPTLARLDDLLPGSAGGGAGGGTGGMGGASNIVDDEMLALATAAAFGLRRETRRTWQASVTVAQRQADQEQLVISTPQNDARGSARRPSQPRRSDASPSAPPRKSDKKLSKNSPSPDDENASANLPAAVALPPAPASAPAPAVVAPLLPPTPVLPAQESITAASGDNVPEPDDHDAGAGGADDGGAHVGGNEGGEDIADQLDAEEETEAERRRRQKKGPNPKNRRRPSTTSRPRRPPLKPTPDAEGAGLVPAAAAAPTAVSIAAPSDMGLAAGESAADHGAMGRSLSGGASLMAAAAPATAGSAPEPAMVGSVSESMDMSIDASHDDGDGDAFFEASADAAADNGGDAESGSLLPPTPSAVKSSSSSRNRKRSGGSERTRKRRAAEAAMAHLAEGDERLDNMFSPILPSAPSKRLQAHFLPELEALRGESIDRQLEFLRQRYLLHSDLVRSMQNHERRRRREDQEYLNEATLPEPEHVADDGADAGGADGAVAIQGDDTGNHPPANNDDVV